MDDSFIESSSNRMVSFVEVETELGGDAPGWQIS